MAHLAGNVRVYVGDVPGVGQVLVTVWPDGCTVATRPEEGDTWGPPTELDER